ncbi:MAG TPA: carboxymuconolactone decarboxylase family protein [Firmicutes bacterium]|nr:carboxymuconolactone decarboxylase family protein [Bacillota bacterium]
MSRETVHKEMKELLGQVPTFFKEIPDNLIDGEWQVFRQMIAEEHTVECKYKELAGLAVASATRCPYCTYFHSRLARLHGATDEEIQEIVQYAKTTAGWSAYIHGTQQDYDKFCRELDQICKHVEQSQAKQAQAG